MIKKKYFILFLHYANGSNDVIRVLACFQIIINKTEFSNNQLFNQIEFFPVFFLSI